MCFPASCDVYLFKVAVAVRALALLHPPGDGCPHLAGGGWVGPLLPLLPPGGLPRAVVGGAAHQPSTAVPLGRVCREQGVSMGTSTCYYLLLLLLHLIATT